MRLILRALMPTLQQRIDDLIQKVGTLRGEVESWRVQHDYHCQHVQHIDPHVDWWGFAHHKQKCHDAKIEMAALNKKVSEYAAKLEEIMSSAAEHITIQVVTPPQSPKHNDRWHDTTSGKNYVYDGEQQVWTEIVE